MNELELDAYLKANLKVRIEYDSDYDTIDVVLVLKDEDISTAFVRRETIM